MDGQAHVRGGGRDGIWYVAIGESLVQPAKPDSSISQPILKITQPIISFSLTNTHRYDANREGLFIALPAHLLGLIDSRTGLIKDL